MSVNWNIYGHDWAVDFLQRSLINQRARHAYLITGTANIGKNLLAHRFAQALNCEQPDITARPCGTCASCRKIISGNHPDIIYPELDERSGALKIDAARNLMKLLSLKPFSSRYRIAILDQFHLATYQSQDALLKTLEEPSKYAILILVAETTETILSTITSRCQMLALRPASQATVKEALIDVYQADPEQADLLARLSGGRLGWATYAFTEPEVLERRDEFLDMFNTALHGTRADRFSVAAELDKLARKEKSAVRYILELWQTVWRDLLLMKEESPIKPCNVDRGVELEQIALRISREDAYRALMATRHVITRILPTNASVKLATEIMFLQYPMPR